jgi:hypothetical protein
VRTGTKRAGLLLMLGCAAMLGDVLHATPLFALATAWGASPAPKVFTTREGFEGFSARYTLVGEQGSLVLEPDVYARLRGPYNRRNVYGAALAGGPLLAEHPHLGPLHAAVARYAFCRQETVLDELSGESSIGELVEVRVEPRPGTETALPLTLRSPCGS